MEVLLLQKQNKADGVCKEDLDKICYMTQLKTIRVEEVPENLSPCKLEDSQDTDTSASQDPPSDNMESLVPEVPQEAKNTSTVVIFSQLDRHFQRHTQQLNRRSVSTSNIRLRTSLPLQPATNEVAKTNEKVPKLIRFYEELAKPEEASTKLLRAQSSRVFRR